MDVVASDPWANADQSPLTPYPNPTPGPVTVRWSAPGSGALSALVLDASGRCVRRLTVAGGAMAGGLRQLAWDGRDSQGRTVPPGVYFLRLPASEGLRIRPLRVLP